jgi:peroxiredoxin
VRIRAVAAIGLGLAIALSGCSRARRADAGAAQAAGPTAIHPVLIGTEVPNVTLFTPDGQPSSLRAALDQKPTVLVIYRGNWCVYCQRQLADLQKIEPDLLGLGYQIIAVSPDPPAELKKTIQGRQLNYHLLSDYQMNAARLLGLAYYVDDAMRRDLERYGVDLQNLTGQPEWMLPVPAVFLVSADGRIRWEYVNPDYKERVPPEVLLAAARALAEKK